MTATNHPMPNEARTQATNWLPLLTLLVLVIPLRGWLMWNTEVLARAIVSSTSTTPCNWSAILGKRSW